MKKNFKIINKIIITLFILTFIPLLVSLIFILFHTRSGTLLKSDAIVVFGAAVHKNIGPSYTLRNRTLHAAELFKKKLAKYIVVSGAGNENEPLEMKKILVNDGIPEKFILIDNNGYNTKMTIINVKKIMKKQDWKKIIMVSSKYHLGRIHLLSYRKGIPYQGSAPKSIFFAKLLYFYFRECVALIYYLIF